MSPLRLNQVFKDAKVDYGEPSSPLPTGEQNDSAERMKVKQDTLKKAMESKDLTLTHDERLSKAH